MQSDSGAKTPVRITGQDPNRRSEQGSPTFTAPLEAHRVARLLDSTPVNPLFQARAETSSPAEGQIEPAARSTEQGQLPQLENQVVEGEQSSALGNAEEIISLEALTLGSEENIAGEGSASGSRNVTTDSTSRHTNKAPAVAATAVLREALETEDTTTLREQQEEVIKEEKDDNMPPNLPTHSGEMGTVAFSKWYS